MGFGLFGKLPQKRDFLSINLPNAVLNPFETWLQSAVAASRSEIGRQWEDYYLVAPIWRFWLGREILGTACTGSLMPSVDQVGRYFPLAVIYYAEPGENLTPPLLNPVDAWYRQIEERMLAVLSEDNPIETGAILTGLTPPDYSSPPPRPVVLAPVPRTLEVVEPAPVAPMAEPPPPPPPEPPVAAVPPQEEAAPPAATVEPAPEIKVAIPAHVDVKRETTDIGDWMPEPMPTDRLAELQKISAASFAPDSPMASVPASLWDVPADKASAAPLAAPVAAGPMFAPIAPMPELPAAAAAPAQPATAAPPTASPFGAPMSVLSAGAPLSAAPAAAPVTPREAPPTPPAEPAVAAPPAPMAMPTQREGRITTGDFKGGLIAIVEDGGDFGGALPQLMAADFGHAAQGRSYWWCGPSSGGGPRLFAKSGLPDPYFFTRMLMWSGR